MVNEIKYELTTVSDEEMVMDIKDGVIMIQDAYTFAKEVAKVYKIRVLRVTQLGVYLVDYFLNLDSFSIARSIQSKQN